MHSGRSDQRPNKNHAGADPASLVHITPPVFHLAKDNPAETALSWPKLRVRMISLTAVSCRPHVSREATLPSVGPSLTKISSHSGAESLMADIRFRNGGEISASLRNGMTILNAGVVGVAISREPSCHPALFLGKRNFGPEG